MTKQEIFDLIARFENSSIQTMKLSTGDFSMELSKAVSDTPVVSVPTPAAAPQAVDNDHAIAAPLVGTYYAAPAPDAPAFVQVGDKVKKGDTVCLIEAMKMISEIPAPCDCTITAILKENGSLAAFHEPLFRYEPC